MMAGMAARSWYSHTLGQHRASHFVCTDRSGACLEHAFCRHSDLPFSDSIGIEAVLEPRQVREREGGCAVWVGKGGSDAAEKEKGDAKGKQGERGTSEHGQRNSLFVATY